MGATPSPFAQPNKNVREPTRVSFVRYICMLYSMVQCVGAVATDMRRNDVPFGMPLPVAIRRMNERSGAGRTATYRKDVLHSHVNVRIS